MQEYCNYKGLRLSPPISAGVGKKGNSFFISGSKERLISLLQTFGEKESESPNAKNENHDKRPISDVFVLLQIALIYPFDTCVNWWCKGFENRHVEQIGSYIYDRWVNGVEKWVC